MAYSNSPLATYIKRSPFYSSRNGRKISKITIHHTAGVTTVEQLGAIFSKPDRDGSSNYGIGCDARIGMFVDEKYRAWTSGSYANDSVAVTIEVSNSKAGEPWPVSDDVYEALILLCADICRRNKIPKLIFTGDATGTLTAHRYFQATACPGTYLYSRFAEIANDVNALLEDPMILEKIEALEKRVKELEDQVALNYNTPKSIPSWATYTTKMINDKIIKGNSGKDLGLSLQMIRENEFCGRLIDSKLSK